MYHPNEFLENNTPNNNGSTSPYKMTHSTLDSFVDARPILPLVSFFMGDLRDGLAMINMQSTYLMTSKHFSEKQLGTLSFVFGISQCIFIGPAGYFLDYSNSKIAWVVWTALAVSLLVILTAAFAIPGGENMQLMIIFKFLQGAATAFLPPGFNGITLGIVGSTGFTHQVSRNKMMNHLGTALVVAIASLLAYALYPKMGLLFITSPIFCFGFVYYILKIRPTDVDLDAASSLIIRSPTMTEYETMDEQQEIAEMMSQAEDDDEDECIFGGMGVESREDSDYIPPNGTQDENELSTPKSISASESNTKSSTSLAEEIFNKGRTSWCEFKRRQAESPLAVFLDRRLMLFSVIFFLFHLANSAILPLVMQSLEFEDMRHHLLMSGLCIMIGQTFMMFFAKICGDYSPVWGRRVLFLTALFSLPLRCGILVFLLSVKLKLETTAGINIINILMLSTQFLDAVGAGISGTLYILITNDISGGTGRFSMMMGITSGAMCLGCTISGYLGQSLAEDYEYRVAIAFLGLISLVPAFMYLMFMPETLQDWAKTDPESRRKRIVSLFKEMNRRRKSVFSKNAKKLSAKFRGGSKSKQMNGRINEETKDVFRNENNPVLDGTQYLKMV